MASKSADYDQVVIVSDMNGGHWIEGDPPEVVSWCPGVLKLIEQGGCTWTNLYDGVITMNLRGGPVRYRLTGEQDFGGGYVAVLVGDDIEAPPTTQDRPERDHRD